MKGKDNHINYPAKIKELEHRNAVLKNDLEEIHSLLKQAREKISISYANLNALLESTKNLIWSTDASLRISITNNPFRGFFLTHYNKEIKTGDHILKVLPENEQAKWRNYYGKALQGEQFSVEEWYTTDGLKIFYENTFYPILDDQHRITGITVISVNITERKITQDAIRESEEIFRQLAENTTDVFILSTHSSILYANPAFERIYGRGVEDLIADPSLLEEAIYPPDKKEYLRHVKKEIDLKKPGKGIQYRIQQPDGELKNVWTRIFPVEDNQGQVYRYVYVTSDMTGLKELESAIISTEETLREREEHFRALLQNSSDAISILDKEGAILFESSYHNKILDFERDELLNKPIFEIVHPDDVESFRDTFREILNNPKKQIKKEYRSLHKNKRWIYVESILSNQLSNPFIKGIIMNSRDITERKMGEFKERVYHDNLIFLSNSALDLLGLSSIDNIYLYIAEKLSVFLKNAVVVVTSYREETGVFIIEKIAGIARTVEDVAEILGRSPIGMQFNVEKGNRGIEGAGTINIIKEEYLKDNLGEISGSQFFRIRERLKVHKVYNIGMARHNKLLGNVTILTLDKSIIKFKHILETFIHQVSVVLHRSLLEFELIKAKEKAEESDKLKTAFLANMSHEIRTPMNGILGFAEMLNDDTLSLANRKKYLGIINSNGKMLINLIDDIIDFAKIEADQLNIMTDDFSLNNLLAQLHSSFSTESLRKEKSELRILFRKALTNDNCYIRTDPNRLRQILTNLIGNSIKFTQTGFIEFGYRLEKKHQLLFYVKDTGIGISKDKLDLIFERFMQADVSSTRKYGGSGLGLAISKGLVELLGGKMWAESVVHEGSTFYFTLPYVPAIKKDEDSEEKKRPKTNYNWVGKLFLIAEDDKFSYKFLEGFLRQTGADVMHAADGHEAVNLCRNHETVDLVLMDIQMPEMNGLEATTAIKQFRKNVPVIAQTANAIAEERQKCLEAGCDDFISKPININELYAKIDKWLSVKHN